MPIHSQIFIKVNTGGWGLHTFFVCKDIHINCLTISYRESPYLLYVSAVYNQISKHPYLKFQVIATWSQTDFRFDCDFGCQLFDI